MSERPLILVTNDDGVHAPGIQALSAALAAVGEVHVVAPDREMSACAQALTLKQPLRAESLGQRVHAVDGTPADCVNLAILKLLPAPPALVCAGINSGGNLGDDVFYSGTVGGAREGTFFGVPSLAFSLAARSETDFSHAAAFAVRLARLVLAKGLPPRTLLNVNVPAGKPSCVAWTVQGRRDHEGNILEGLDPRRRTYYWIEEGRDRWASDEMADVYAVRRSLISITPLHNDATHHALLPLLKGWDAALNDGDGT